MPPEQNQNDHDNDTDLLTDEERAALAAGEGEEIDGSASLTGEDTDDWVNNGWGAPPEDKPEAEGQGEGEGEGSEGQGEGDDPPTKGEEPAPEPEPEPEPEPQKQQAPPVDLSAFDEKLEQFRKDEEALLDQYDDGDLTREELAQKRAELSGQVAEVTGKRAVAERQMQDETNRWNGAVADYFKEYPGLKDDKAISAFDAEVRAVTSNPLLADKPYQKQLEIAHKRLLNTAEDIGLENVPELKGAKKKEPEPEPEPKPQQKGEQKSDPRGDDMRTPPKTLARVPASEISGEGESEFAGLQRMMDDENVSPDDKEAALAKLTPEQRDRFASSNV